MDDEKICGNCEARTVENYQIVRACLQCRGELCGACCELLHGAERERERARLREELAEQLAELRAAGMLAW